MNALPDWLKKKLGAGFRVSLRVNEMEILSFSIPSIPATEAELAKLLKELADAIEAPKTEGPNKEL